MRKKESLRVELNSSLLSIYNKNWTNVTEYYYVNIWKDHSGKYHVDDDYDCEDIIEPTSDVKEVLNQLIAFTPKDSDKTYYLNGLNSGKFLDKLDEYQHNIEALASTNEFWLKVDSCITNLIFDEIKITRNDEGYVINYYLNGKKIPDKEVTNMSKKYNLSQYYSYNTSTDVVIDLLRIALCIYPLEELDFSQMTADDLHDKILSLIDEIDTL